MTKLDSQLNKLVNNSDTDAVVFDLFTCMIKNDTGVAADIYDVVRLRLNLDDEFRQKRVLAERLAREKLHFTREEVSLDDIYIQLKSIFGYQDNDIQKIKQTELDVLYDYSRPRKWIQEKYNTAVKNGKKIIIISSTYYPVEFLRKILDKNGYKDVEKIFTTSELGLSIGSGRFYEKLKVDLSKSFGDKYALIANSKDYRRVNIIFGNEVPVVLIKETLPLYKCKKINMCYDNDAVFCNKNALIHKFIANNEFDKYEPKSKVENTLENYSYESIGSFILSICANLINDITVNRINRLVFIGEDSLFFKDLIEAILKASSQKNDVKIELKSQEDLSYIENSFIEELINPIISPGSSVSEFISQKMHISDASMRKDALKVLRNIGYRTENSIIGDFNYYTSAIGDLNSVYEANKNKINQNLKNKAEALFTSEERVGVFQVFEPYSVGKDVLKPLGIYRKDYYAFTTVGHKNTYATSEHKRVLFKNKSNKFSIVQGIDNLLKDVAQSNYSACSDLKLIQSNTKRFVNDFSSNFSRDLLNLSFDTEKLYDYLLTDTIAAMNSGNDSILNLMTNYSEMQSVNKKTNGAYKGSKEKTSIYKKLYVVGYKLKIIPLLKKIFKVGTVISDEKITFNSFKKAYSDAKKVLDNFTSSNKKPNVVFAGMMLGSTKGTAEYINELWKHTTEKNIVLLSEYNNKRLNQFSIEHKIYSDYFVMPVLLSKNSYDAGVKIKTTNEIENTIASKQYLVDAVANVQDMNRVVDNGYIKTQIYFVYKLFNDIIDKLNPEKMILWNQFHAFNSILKKICDEREIPVMYFEFGVIPGTYVIEKQGQMGESYPATNYKEFMALKYKPEELEETKEVIDFLRKTKQNRNAYDVRSNITKLTNRLEAGKPIIMYAGQYDHEAGLYPYTDHSKKYHSPNFESSNATAMYLYKVCQKNGWNFIYKPHPLLARITATVDNYPKGMIVVTDVDIHDVISISDVVVTLFSQTAYLSLIAQKATLMLGYNQLKGKECVYEAYEKEKIESAIKSAIENGYTDEMKEKFAVHTTQLLKNYLYHDLNDREYIFGKELADMVNIIEEDA